MQTLEPVNPILREQVTSLLGVLLVADGLIGVMHVDSATLRRFTEELRLLQRVADRVALCAQAPVGRHAGMEDERDRLGHA